LTGVAGTSVNGAGVYGQTEELGDLPFKQLPGGLLAGVVGMAKTQPGVLGWASDDDGIQGFSFGGGGVLGVSRVHPGVSGEAAFASGVSGQCGNAGPTVPNTSNIAGVVGGSDQQHGVIGTTRANVGVIGFSTNNIGVLGYTTTGPFAGFFLGNVHITGRLTSDLPKGAVVPFPDGTKRLLVCMESPEPWFEDFGSARLKHGRATVKLDADFAKVITLNDYRVFLTPEGDCQGLYVRRRGQSFEVRELQGGTSSIAFSYRIVGKRKDVKGHKRFAKIDTRLALPPARPPRPPKPTAAALRAFIARVEKEARQRAPKDARKRGRSRGVDKDSRLLALRAQAARQAKKIGRAEER
jgi:hypothetical protein